MASKIVRYTPPELTREQSLEGVRLASFRRRFAAFGVDMTIVAIVFMAVTLLLLPWLIRNGWYDPEGQLNLRLSFDNWYSLILIVLYFALGHYWGNGKTLGKRLFRIRVISTKNVRLRLWNCVQRALGYGASTLTGLGFFQVIWKPDRRAAHDIMTETIVVDERPIT